MTQPILIVEDDPDGQALVSHVVGHLHLANEVVADAEQAGVRLFESGQRYHAVIIDLALPGKDGWELLSEIRRNPATAGITCIAVTAYHSAKTREEALRAGFNAYFAKPLEATHFARELSSLLGT